ncbi:hypothetical protein CBR_g18698 [Chara braunii]|uniref:Uncharacterized protein n=1 Tax=Chara braunii TaxID=69332 RepID=A0A388KW61_CHABU|nr:hypothetical protein CBR_g18698 [Chara braunii]|eukprot:GBG74287.1 hypothetical protein CBR_g18698 [Chara braunii]
MLSSRKSTQLAAADADWAMGLTESPYPRLSDAQLKKEHTVGRRRRRLGDGLNRKSIPKTLRASCQDTVRKGMHCW